MGKFGKILAVLGVLTVGAVVVSKTAKKAKMKQYSSIKRDVTSRQSDTIFVESEEQEENKISARLIKAAFDKAAGILIWAADHEKEVKGATLTVELVGAGIGVIFVVKNGLKNSNKRILKELEAIKDDVYCYGYHMCFEDVKRALCEAVNNDGIFKMFRADGSVVAKYIVQEVAA